MYEVIISEPFNCLLNSDDLGITKKKETTTKI